MARSTFRSQNAQSTPGPHHFWQLRCRKSARGCGAKHISKSKYTKHTRSGPLLAVEMSKKCHNVQSTPGPDHFWQMSKKCTGLWCEAHFEVKMYKAHQLWKLRCRKVHGVVARSTFRSQNTQSTPGPDHSWQLRCRKSARRCGAKHISKSKYTKHTRSGPLLAVEMSK